MSTVELMITLVITALLMTLAAPAMGTFLRDNRLQSVALGLMRVMYTARSEAAKRKTRVVLCRSADPGAATPSCGGTAYNWGTGYLMFASGDGNSTYDEGTDELLRAGTVEAPNVTLVTNSTSNNNLEYNFDGTTNEGGSTARFAICDTRGGEHGFQIDVSPVGRPKIVSGADGSPVGCTSPS